MPDHLAHRLDRLEAIGEIRQLMALYAKYADNGWPGGAKDAGALARLFTEDGVWDSGVAGAFEGQAAIEGYFRLLGFREPAWDAGPVRMKVGVHMAINPAIVVDGDQAHGVWRGFVTRVLPESRQSHILVGKYVNAFRKIPDGWRIRRLTFVPAFSALNETSWTLTPIPSSGPDAASVGKSNDH